MTIRSITVRGFKSFPDRTQIEFEPGATIIVGPNGSGKSNIIDAILWVLGEQGTRTLRLSRMEDVIFSGSATKPSLGFAEVSLTLDNSNKIIPLEFSEISITRRVFRSGESDYFINNILCRLLDIQELLPNANIGKTYSIVGQGELEQILNSRPEELRTFFEEASGVLKYIRRKEKAMRKLSRIDQNLILTSNLLRELKREINPLKDQAEKAKVYHQYLERLKELEVASLAQELNKLKNIWENGEAEQKEIEKNLEDKKGTLGQKEECISKFTNEYNQKIDFIEKIRNKYYSFLREKDSLESLLALIGERKNQFDKELLRSNNLKEKDSEKEKNLFEQKNILGKEIDQAHQEIIENERNIQADKEYLEKINNELVEILQKNNRLQQVKFLRRTYENELKKMKSKKLQIEKKIEDLQEAILERDKKIKILAGEDINKLNLSIIGEQLQKLQQTLTEDHTRYETLKKIEQTMGDYPKSVSWVLQQKIKFPQLLGCLCDLIKASNGYEKSIESALGEDLYSLITRTKDEAGRIAGEIRKQKIGKVTIFSLDNFDDKKIMENKNNPKYLINLLKFPSNIYPVLSHLLHQYEIAENFEKAKQYCLNDKSEDIFITKEGEIFSNKKIRAGIEGKEIKGILIRKKEISELEKNLLKLRDEQKVWQNLEILAREKENLEKSLIDEKEEFNWLVKEIDLLNDNIAHQVELVKELTEEIKTTPETEGQISEMIEKIKKKESQLLAEKEEINKAILNKSTRLSILKEKSNYFSQNLKNISQKINEIALENEKYRKINQLYLKEINQIIDMQKLVKKLLDKGDELTKKVEKEIEHKEREREEANKQIEQLKSEISMVNPALQELKEKISQLNLTQAELKFKVDAIAQKITEEYHLSLNEALENYIGEVDEEEVELLREKISSIGEINPLADEHFASLEERYNFLASQSEDLRTSKFSLKKVARLMDKKIKENFLTTFESVNENFQKIFSFLFPYGRAELMLADPEDVIHTGIEILAEPQGKRLKKLSLFSGGEKSLIALSLLFALFETSASSFYILDEVEAALDDINLKRFISLLKKYKYSHQLIVVTHQKRTMDLADILYGVSMGPDGVSKIVSERVEKYKVAN